MGFNGREATPRPRRKHVEPFLRRPRGNDSEQLAGGAASPNNREPGGIFRNQCVNYNSPNVRSTLTIEKLPTVKATTSPATETTVWNFFCRYSRASCDWAMSSWRFLFIISESPRMISWCC